MNSKLNALQQIPFFLEFSKEELEPLSKKLRIKNYAKNTIILTEGDESTSVYFILEGSVRVYIENEQGREVTLNEINEGETFGELALFCNTPRTASILAKNKCKVLLINKNDFIEFYSNNPKAAQKIVLSMATTIKKLTKDLENFALNNVHRRVVRALLDHSINIDGRRIVKGLTHKDIANLVASSRETVSRVIHDLKKDGLIQVKNGKINIKESAITD